ncbi:hypothetical protein [Lysinibacillus sp. NPDC093216]|uniref:hypothetical protein n=1 Tax=Lysinibacillus sp. NPDC093216 TaxID=3390576 RepID=UPI003D0143C1
MSMEMTTKEILNTLKIFSDTFNIPPPNSNDIGSWWDQVVNDMDIELLYLLHDNNVLGRFDDDVLVFMNSLLANRINDLEIVAN